MSLRRAWHEEAANWIRWVRAPGHDSYWRFHAARFLELVPPPGRLTLDLGAGEGRVARDLRARGHHVVEFDSSPAMAGASAALGGRALVADLASLPVASGAADLAVAVMSLQDVDDMALALAEARRVLGPRDCLVLAIVHPINSAGGFEDDRGVEQPFVIRDSYFAWRRSTEHVERGGLPMRFTLEHRPLEAYAKASRGQGFHHRGPARGHRAGCTRQVVPHPALPRPAGPANLAEARRSEPRLRRLLELVVVGVR
jgi:SAM-dependent methyltransferase